MTTQGNPVSQERPNGAHVSSAQTRREHGRSLRGATPRKVHAVYEPAADRPDPIALLEASNAGRVPSLVPLRYGRMATSPFAFFRGSAALMAADLATTPATGIIVQASGDCHLLNFGAHATPERMVVIDLNDFDETLPAPWEWDLKRLATSFVLACRENSFGKDAQLTAAATVGRAYREGMRDFSRMRALDLWYSKLDLESYISGVKDRRFRRAVIEEIERQREKSNVDYYVPKWTVEKDGHPVFRETPPRVYHPSDLKGAEPTDAARAMFLAYKASLPDERRVLLDRFVLQDVAMKVVGIGSVGTYCAVLLFLADENDSLILQLKEARASVLEAYAGKSSYAHHGQRVVIGQRLLQAHTDVFLGWTTGEGEHPRHFYVRQLRDMKMTPVPASWTEQRTMEVAEALGSVLARAHARSGDAAGIDGYLGSRDAFDVALAQFAVSYADQAERDHEALLHAIESGRVVAQTEH
jgi:uncharacterized protein (DUF2252 family)